ncbi:MAG: hypothetical protein ACRD6X_10320 [Pyrinomonadaceae bacterium]
MREAEHLHTSEIIAFRKGMLTQPDKDDAARHLLLCGDCRDLLPEPNPNEFWACLFLERPQPPPVLKESWFTKGLFSGRGNWAVARSRVMAGMLFLAVGGLSLALFNRLLPARGDVAAGIPKPADSTRQPSQIGTVDGNDSTESNTNQNQLSTNSSIMNGSMRDTPPSGGVLLARKDSTTMDRRPPGGTLKLRRTETRGSERPCLENEVIGLEFKAVGPGVRLSWSKVARASLYSVYISDLDERLVDQFETTDKTSYVVARPLSPDTIYKWKLIVTLTDGTRIVGASQNFTTKDASENTIHENKGINKQKTAAKVRCGENKQ